MALCDLDMASEWSVGTFMCSTWPQSPCRAVRLCAVPGGGAEWGQTGIPG